MRSKFNMCMKQFCIFTTETHVTGVVSGTNIFNTYLIKWINESVFYNLHFTYLGLQTNLDVLPQEACAHHFHS